MQGERSKIGYDIIARKIVISVPKIAKIQTNHNNPFRPQHCISDLIVKCNAQSHLRFSGCISGWECYFSGETAIFSTLNSTQPITYAP